MQQPLFSAEIFLAETTDQPHLVSVRITNVSLLQQLYAPFLICKPNGMLENALFRVRDKAGNKRPYHGMRKKRAAPDFENFLALETGMFLQFTADLDTGWRFPPENAPYQVQYSVLNPHPDPQIPLQRVESAWLSLMR